MHARAWDCICVSMGVVALLLTTGLAATSEEPAAPKGGANPAELDRLLALPAARKPHYACDFEKKVGDEWSNQQVDTAPAGGGKFLGRFSNNSATLSLTDLPRHAYVRVRLDLLIIHSWDGGQSEYGPDVWQMLAIGGPTLVRASFDHGAHRKQSFPDNMPLVIHAGATGAAAQNVLGFNWEGQPLDARYRIDVVFPHAGDHLDLRFGAGGLQGVEDESWGIDNVSVELLGTKQIAALTPEQAARLLALLDGSDAALAQRAMARLVVGGKAAADALRKRMGVTPDLPSAFAALVRQLDSASFSEREAATETLVKMGPVVIAPLKREYERTESAEVRARITRILERLDSLGRMDVGTERARWALQIIEAGRGDSEAKQPPSEAGDQNG